MLLSQYKLQQKHRKYALHGKIALWVSPRKKIPTQHLTVCKSLRKEQQADAERVVREKEQSRNMSSILCLFYCLSVFQKTS